MPIPPHTLTHFCPHYPCCSCVPANSPVCKCLKLFFILVAFKSDFSRVSFGNTGYKEDCTKTSSASVSVFSFFRSHVLCFIIEVKEKENDGLSTGSCLVVVAVVTVICKTSYCSPTGSITHGLFILLFHIFICS